MKEEILKLSDACERHEFICFDFGRVCDTVTLLVWREKKEQVIILTSASSTVVRKEPRSLN